MPLMSRHHLLDLRNRTRRVQTLGAGSRAVQDGVAPVHAHAVVERRLALGRLQVTRIGQPPVRLEENGGSEVLLAVPPVRGAGRRAAGAQNAFVQTVQLLAVLGALTVLQTLCVVRTLQPGTSRDTYILGLGVVLEIRLDGLVLLVELGQVGHQILDDVGVRQRVDARFLGGIGGNTAYGSQKDDLNQTNQCRTYKGKPGC